MIHTEIQLRCDRCGEASHWFDGSVYTIGQILKELRELGWVRRRGGRLAIAGTECPNCSRANRRKH